MEQTKMKNKILKLIIAVTMFTLAGCESQPFFAAQQPTAPKPQLASAERFQNSEQKNTAVDSAVRLARENSGLLNENTQLKEKIAKLTEENNNLNTQIKALKPQLEQAKKELAQANDFLIDMTTELNNWKMQVLGFQDEMRIADKTQMEILIKIAKAMGAEVEIPEQKALANSDKLTAGESNE